MRVLARKPALAVAMVDYTLRAAVISDFDAQLLEVANDVLVQQQFEVFRNRKGRPVMGGRTTFLADQIELRFSVSIS